jgi:DnaJ-class molecular chaperone
MDDRTKSEPAPAKPDRPRNAETCKKCRGKAPRRNTPPCQWCGGKGWLTPEELRALTTPPKEDDDNG